MCETECRCRMTRVPLDRVGCRRFFFFSFFFYGPSGVPIELSKFNLRSLLRDEFGVADGV